MGGSDTRSAVLDRFVGDGELRKVMTDHFSLDFDGVERFAVVDPNDTSDHFWDDKHVSQMGLDHSRLLVRWGFLPGFS